MEQYKVGHLPINVKKFLQFDSDDCINHDNNNLKYKYTCLLRYGVQNDKNNSFLVFEEAEAKYTLLYESTLRLLDFYIRRTGRMFFLINSIKTSLEQVADLFAAHFHWSENQKHQEIQSVLDEIQARTDFN